MSKPKELFRKDQIYFYNQGVGYDPEFPDYPYIQPVMDDPGNIMVVDAYVVNGKGVRCPGYEVPVPVLVEEIGRRSVSSMRRKRV